MIVKGYKKKFVDFHLLTFFDLKNIHAAGIIDQTIFTIDP